MRRVVLNLVDNAVEAMERARRPSGRRHEHDPGNNLLRIVVADDGPGIPAGERDKLFLPYYSTKQRGSGLGLAIVRRIVAEHGGAIDVADNVPRGNPVHDRAALLMIMPPSSIVDDEPGVRSALGGVLRDEGYDVEAVDSGEACLERAQPRSRSMSIAARRLAARHGRLGDAGAAARAAGATPQVVIISGHGNVESAVRAIKMGAFDFVEKPLSLDKTVLVVRNALRQRRLEAENRALRAQRRSPARRWWARATRCASCASRWRWRRRPTAAC